jgi:hypothetical protein
VAVRDMLTEMGLIKAYIMSKPTLPCFTAGYYCSNKDYYNGGKYKNYPITTNNPGYMRELIEPFFCHSIITFTEQKKQDQPPPQKPLL